MSDYLISRSSLKRMNSNPKNKNSEDAQSLFISGNLDQVTKKLEDIYTDDEDDADPEDEIDEKEAIFVESDAFKDTELVKRADELLFDQFGVKVLETIAASLLEGILSPTDLTIQALAYKCQRIKRGKRGVRYKESWGNFWCGVRTLIKGRGLVPFMDHFELPSKLSKFKPKILRMCGLNPDTLGKPGLQTQNTHLWLQGKKEEVGTKTLCLSISLDGKKIAVSQDGQEDMGGVGDTATKKQIDTEFENEKCDIITNIEANSRESFYKLYDSFSASGKCLVSKITAIEKLIAKNSKQIEKNPVLSKYIFVLKQQLKTGETLLNDLSRIQIQLVQHISDKRRCLQLLSETGIPLDLAAQANYFKLAEIETWEEDSISLVVDSVLANNSSLLQIPWDEIVSKIERPLEKILKSSVSCARLYQLCYLSASQTYEACGLGSTRPLQDMKKIYNQTQDMHSNLETMKSANNQTVGTFCSNFSSVTFGNNARIIESGIFIEKGFCATPDLLVVNTSHDALEYIVIFAEVETNTFECSQELLTTGLISMKICKPSKGCILVVNSKISFVAFSLSMNDSLAESMVDFIDKYLKHSKCLTKRTKEQLETIETFRIELKKIEENITTLGIYPLVENVFDSTRHNLPRGASNVYFVPPSKNRTEHVIAPLQHEDFVKFLDDKRKYLAKQARELIVCNISDLSGQPSQYPHTICGATFLSSASLKVVVRDCLKETRKMIEQDTGGGGAQVLNFGLDGESIHLATSKSNGEPGTLISLGKYLVKLVKSFKKTELVKMIASNNKITITNMTNEDIEEIIEDIPADLLDLIHENIAVEQNETGFTGFSLEDIEDWLNEGSDSVDIGKEEECKILSVRELRIIAVKFVFPKAKKAWLSRVYGTESLCLDLCDQTIYYTPSTIFDKSDRGYFTTLSFDMAHISNLLREAAAKDKLQDLGLSRESLDALSTKTQFKYLKKVLKLKNNKLEFDPMNQKASALCFSQKTEDGLNELSDRKGAKCCRLLRKGIIEALDKTGISSETRVKNVFELKAFLDEKINLIDRLNRPGIKTISNELLQMIHCSLDSHMVSFLNMSHFNSRRKGTLTVEQFFGAITLMADGGVKLDCRNISDILERVMICNALRMLPVSVKGFKFLTMMKVHMTSYEAEADEDDTNYETDYPTLFSQRVVIMPLDAPQDKPTKKRKRNLMKAAMKDTELVLDAISGESQVRKYHKKF